MKNKLKTIFLLLCIIAVIPSILYIIKGNQIYNLVSDYNVFYGMQIPMGKVLGSILFPTVFGGMFIIYFMIIKYHKDIFKSTKQMITFVAIISIIFIMILPLTSTDIFYYIGTGWSDSHYNINPYYTSVGELIAENNEAANDQMLLKMRGIWENQTIVYGPLWPMICKVLSGLSFGNLTVALFIYKFFNLCMHIANTYIIYKITKKKIFAIMYGLNPLILMECLSNVHNEMLVIFLIVLALYFFIVKRKMALTIIAFALATAVKYYAILFVPFTVLYYYQKEKISKKILYSCAWACLFLVILVLCYMVYMQDLGVLKGIVDQQEKIANSFYLFIGINEYQLAVTIAQGIMTAFIAVYIIEIMKLLFSDQTYTFSYYVRKYQWLLLLFIFTTITNFQSWYITWLFPGICFQKSKHIRFNLSIMLSGRNCKCSVFYI